MRKEKGKLEKYKRVAVFAELKDYCTFSRNIPGDFIEVTRWKNFEGFDVSINAGSNKIDFKITHGQFDALKDMIKKLDN